MAPTDVVVPKPPTSPRPPKTPPNSPELPQSEQVLTLKHVQQVLELLKTVQNLQPPGEALQPVKTEETSRDKQKVMARVSKLEFKTVSEIWDAKTYEYKIKESITPSDAVKGLGSLSGPIERGEEEG